MSRPRILIFSLAYFPYIGGAEVAVKEITDRLPEYDFDLISADIKSRRAKYFFPFWAYREAVSRHQIQKYALVWAIMANQAGMAAALFKRRFPEVPLVLTLQEGDDIKSFFYRGKLLGPRLFGVFQKPDYLTAISNYLAEWARQMGAKNPVAIVPNGVDLDKFPVLSPGSPVGGRAKKVIITTSRLVRKNGLDDLITSLKYLPENVELYLIGTGPQERALKRKAYKLGLASRVRFHGYVSPEQIPFYLAHADVFVRPSRSEGLGNSFLEAMSCGLPVVGTPVGGIPDFLREDETGWFCKVNDSKSIAEKVKFILDSTNRAVVERVKKTARELVEQKYTWSQIAAQMGHIFRQLIHSTKIKVKNC